MTKAQAETFASLIVGNSPMRADEGDYKVRIIEQGSEMMVSFKTADSTFRCKVNEDGEIFDKTEERIFHDW